MSQQERTVIILSQLEARGQMTVSDICTLFSISRDTARRDIVYLEGMGLIERFHGGIRKPFLLPHLRTYRSRLVINPHIKKLLGVEAAKLVQDNDVIMLDLSATLQFVGEQVTAENVLIVTNSIDTGSAVLNKGNASVYLTGGFLQPEVHALTGMSVLERVSEFHFNTAFISATAISPDGIYYTTHDDVVLKKRLKQISDKVALVSEHTKFSEVASFRLDFSNIDIMITDKAPPSDLMEAFDKHNIRVVVAGEGI